jgi:predicted O-methyltransferase YrrM
MSATSTAQSQALPADGCLVACDISSEWTDLAQPYWKAAGVAERIDLRLGEAKHTLDAMLAAGEAGTYDFAFVDADKEGYGDYVAQLFELLRPGGILSLDNMLMGGRVLDAETEDPGPRHIIELSQTLWHDPRFEPVFVPVGDGLALLRKR